MKKKFNITGTCNPQRHYMVNMSRRFEGVKELVDSGEYFTINRARQYGKTTMLQTIRRRLSDQYLVISVSFEGLDGNVFSDVNSFIAGFCRLVSSFLRNVNGDEKLIKIIDRKDLTTLDSLSRLIADFCDASEKPVVLTIDEVDQSSDNQLFLNFLGMLRNKYLEREDGLASTFHSVILAGVYDIKNLKLKLRPDAERKYNSPWNIAADFKVDMTFHPDEIAQMLNDYEQDAHTGMDINAISQEIYKYTTGYPVLVSMICKLIDEDYDRDWTADGVLKAVKYIVTGNNTLMDDLSKNLENNTELREFLYSISVNSVHYSFVMVDPMVKLAAMFSYIRNQDGEARIHNLIFEEALYLYFTLACLRKDTSKLVPYQSTYVVNGKLNMEYVLSRFRDLMHEEYRESTVPFLEREGRLLFLTFLKPVINGTGFYYVEPQTRDSRRMDLIVTYGQQEFVIELKIWRGEAYEQSGRDQLADYLDTRHITEGYLVTFDFSKTPHDPGPQWTSHRGKRIFEVVI